MIPESIIQKYKQYVINDIQKYNMSGIYRANSNKIKINDDKLIYLVYRRLNYEYLKSYKYLVSIGQLMPIYIGYSEQLWDYISGDIEVKNKTILIEYFKWINKTIKSLKKLYSKLIKNEFELIY